MRQQHVDIVCAQASQAGVQRLFDALCREIKTGHGIISMPARLGRQQNILPFANQGIAEPFFRQGASVVGGHIEIVDAASR